MSTEYTFYIALCFRLTTYMGRTKPKGVFEHAKIAHIQTIPRMRNVWSGHLLAF